MSEDIRWVKTHCARMDHGGCGLLVGIKENRICRIKGDPDGYLNRGYICPKGLAAADRLNHPKRLLKPLKRTGSRGTGQWRQISWDEALDTISTHLLRIKADYGPQSVVFAQGMPKGMEHFALIRLANMFGSPNVMGTQDVCHAPREVSGIHTCGFFPVVDFHDPSRLVVLWGSNPLSTNEEGTVGHLLSRQIKQGTQLMVIDPRRNRLAEKARFWLQIKPGSDNKLALAFLNVIITEKLWDKPFVEKWTRGFDALADHIQPFTPERIAPHTWIAPDLIRESARFYARTKPAALHWGNAIEHQAHVFDTARALCCLMAITGNLDVAGGNIAPSEPKIMRLGQMVRADCLPSKPKQMLHVHHGTIPRMMTVPPAYFQQAVLDEVPYPVKGAYMQGVNPLVNHVQSVRTAEALKKLDFLAVSDIVMTPTAAMADIVLPAATTFEFDDIGHIGLGHGVVLARPKVVDPPPDCRPDVSIINDLGKRMTDPAHWFGHPNRFLDKILAPAGYDFKRFCKTGYLTGEKRFKKYETAGFKTPSGKVELALSKAKSLGCEPLPTADANDEPPNADYPYVLTSRKSIYYLHSAYRWLAHLRKYHPHPRVEIHPETAAGLDIKEGDAVVVETANGRIEQRAHLSERIKPRVIYCDSGWWFNHKEGQKRPDWQTANYNMLTSAKVLGKQFGTPHLKGLDCRIFLKRA